MPLREFLNGADPEIYRIRSRAPGPTGRLPLTEAMLRDEPSGNLFGLSQNAGMGWNPDEVGRDPFLILSTQGGMRAPDGSPVALGYHTGHWEISELVRTAAVELRALKKVPFAGFVSDPCDGRTQGTTGMFDSLPYRNDAAIVFRRLVRSLPTRRGVIGVATCDKGLPAMMMALAGIPDLPAVLVPGGVTLPPAQGEDAGSVQTLGARFSHGLVTLDEAADLGCRACASPGGGCQFLGTAATAQVVGEALGLSLPHSALAPSGEPVWRDLGTQSARAAVALALARRTTRDVLTDASIRNAMVVHAAFGGSTNLLLHIPAIAHAAGLRRPTVDDWTAVNRSTPRLVSVLPNGPVHHPTVRVFLAGGVPEVMRHLRDLGLLDLNALTVTGQPLGEVIDTWENSNRRTRFRELLRELDGVDPDDVILSPPRAKERGLTSTVTFPRGNLAPEGSVIKSTSIDPSVVGSDGVYRHEGPARIFTREREAIAAIKRGDIKAGDVLVLMGAGPLGTGMEETYQLTSALKHLPFGRHVALVTDARFSGVSTGACLGHVGPEALAGGPVGRLREGDVIRLVVDRNQLTGSVDLVGEGTRRLSAEEGAAVLAGRTAHPGLSPHPDLPEDTRLWALLQGAGGGTWGGCVYDLEAIIRRLPGSSWTDLPMGGGRVRSGGDHPAAAGSRLRYFHHRGTETQRREKREIPPIAGIQRFAAWQGWGAQRTLSGMSHPDLTQLPQTDPTRAYHYRDGLYAADLITAALVHFNLFSGLATQPGTLEEIRSRFGFAARPADVLMTLCAANGFVERDEQGVFRVTASGREFLTDGSSWNLSPYYASLKDRPVTLDYVKVLATGKPANWGGAKDSFDWHKAMEQEAFARMFTATMDCRGRLLGPALAQALDLTGRRRVLDLAGGSGIYACSLVAHHPGLGATVFEQPPVDRIAAVRIAELGFAERVTVEAGDMFRDRLPEDCDVHLFSNVLHDWEEPEVVTLLSRSFDALPSGGLLIIHDAFINAEKTGPLAVAEYSALLMHSTQGKCYATSEYVKLLSTAGFAPGAYVDTTANRGYMTARRP